MHPSDVMPRVIILDRILPAVEMVSPATGTTTD